MLTRGSGLVGALPSKLPTTGLCASCLRPVSDLGPQTGWKSHGTHVAHGFCAQREQIAGERDPG